MAKNTSRIGKDDERQIVKDLEKRGYKARRQPGSGNRAVDLQHDILWHDSPAGKLHIESKYREDCRWKVMEKWRAGADILTVRCDARRSGQEGQRMAFLSWNLLLALVGDAAIRDDLSALEGIDLGSGDSYTAQVAVDGDEIVSIEFPTEGTARLVTEEDRRQRIQSAHQNPKPKPAKRRKRMQAKLPERCETGNHEWYLRSNGSVFCRRCGKEDDERPAKRNKLRSRGFGK